MHHLNLSRARCLLLTLIFASSAALAGSPKLSTEFDTLDDAIAIANASDFGLVAYLWTNDLSAVTKATRTLRAGTIWVNTTLVGDPRAPFGGVKQSGSGREGGIGSVEFYTELKSVVIPNGPAPVQRIGLG